MVGNEFFNNLLELADRILLALGSTGRNILAIMETEIGNSGFSILEAMFGVGITWVIGKTLIKWAIDIT